MSYSYEGSYSEASPMKRGGKGVFLSVVLALFLFPSCAMPIHTVCTLCFQAFEIPPAVTIRSTVMTEGEIATTTLT